MCGSAGRYMYRPEQQYLYAKSSRTTPFSIR